MHNRQCEICRREEKRNTSIDELERILTYAEAVKKEPEDAEKLGEIETPYCTINIYSDKGIYKKMTILQGRKE